jgi:DNA-binding NtrC family response regulator
VERMAILCDSERIDVKNLPKEVQQAPLRETISQLPQKWAEFRRLKQQVQDVAIRNLERRFLVEALQKSGGNVSKAAEDVGMQRTNFHSLMRKHGLASQ